jgi:formylmethanofuran dehydrogenase subunit E
MNTKKVPHHEVVPVLLDAGESVYTYTFTRIDVPVKKSKKVSLCERCGESFIQYEDEKLCKACLNDD